MDGLWRFGDMGALALHAMGALAAAAPARLSGAALAAQLSASPHTVRIVMHRLARAGLLVGTRGVAGGFRLARPADAIPLADVVEAVEGHRPERGCLFGRRICTDAALCPFSALTCDIERQIGDYFHRTSIADLRRAWPDAPSASALPPPPTA